MAGVSRKLALLEVEATGFDQGELPWNDGGTEMHIVEEGTTLRQEEARFSAQPSDAHDAERETRLFDIEKFE